MSRFHTLPVELDWLDHERPMMGSAMRHRKSRGGVMTRVGGAVTRVGGVVTLGGRVPKGSKCVRHSKKGPSGLKRCKKFAMGGAMSRQKRAPSAWNRFMGDYRLANPQVSFAELAREAGAQWRQMSPSEKAKY